MFTCSLRFYGFNNSGTLGLTKTISEHCMKKNHIKIWIQNFHIVFQIMKVDSLFLLFIKQIHFELLLLTDTYSISLRFDSSLITWYYKLFAINVKKLFQSHSGKICDHKATSWSRSKGLKKKSRRTVYRSFFANTSISHYKEININAYNTAFLWYL